MALPGSPGGSAGGRGHLHLPALHACLGLVHRQDISDLSL